HEILRTSFRRPAGMKLPLQVIDERPRISLERAELSGADSLERLLEKERRAFDATQRPALRATLAENGSDRRLLVLTAPTLNADALSLRFIVRELSGLCADGGAEGDIPEQPLQYADFSEWQNEL